MPCYVKSKKKNGFLLTEYRVNGQRYLTGKKLKIPTHPKVKGTPNPMGF